jgi:RNA polymerase sigma-70 factor (ECF subfamily)
MLVDLRPVLHRYCARMTGSAIDGEDVVQEALVKAIEALPAAGVITHPQRWLFRIAHNAALDFLRRRSRRDAVHASADPDAFIDPVSVADQRDIAAASLRTFMRLPAAQRSSVILMDVLGYSLDEIGAVMDSSLAAVKAALHRGRARLRILAQEPDDASPAALADPERALLATYVDRFNARDFDTIRAMLAEEVRLDLVGRQQLRGREVARYFGNYDRTDGWRLEAGQVEGRPAALVYDMNQSAATPAYFVLLTWTESSLTSIRDFRYSRYVMADAAVSTVR